MIKDTESITTFQKKKAPRPDGFPAQFHQTLKEKIISVQFSHSVMSESLRPHELQHSRPPCPSPTPKVHQALLSMEFSKQEYWSGLPFSSPGDLPDPGIEPGSPSLQAGDLIILTAV